MGVGMHDTISARDLEGTAPDWPNVNFILFMGKGSFITKPFRVSGHNNNPAS